MKINQKILSIPPYISTTWKNVAALHLESRAAGVVLIITLNSGTRIEIIGLDPGIIKAIFAAHVSSVELETALQPSAIVSNQDHSVSLGVSSSMDSMGPLLQHNPERSDDPDLPDSFVEKISSLSKMLGIRDPALLPEPEPHCNCMHCQISKAMRSGLDDKAQEELEEIVTDEELKFRTWDIQKAADKLYVVCNPLDTEEHYSVYLGQPVGCTCGNPHCEHIRAVLNS